MSKHAAENLRNYSKMVSSKAIAELKRKISLVIGLNDSTACIVYLAKAVSNPHRNDWKPNNVISAIVRDGKVVTVMMTRTSQVNARHFRTEYYI
jgi:hypothetical protein